ncbi:MAG: ribosome small subunit-dependent GTPase A [bacterium]|nr:ribosome small subunit-dependent GTPase A [bacterium]
MNLEQLGWTQQWQELSNSSIINDMQVARVAQQHRERYVLLGEFGETSAEISGRFRFDSLNPSDFPVVGDWVGVQLLDPDSPAIIHSLLPRQTSLSRNAAGITTEEQLMAANIDIVFLVVGLDNDYNPRRLERWITNLYDSGAEPVILLNKSDICDNVEQLVSETELLAPGLPVLSLSALDNTGLDRLDVFLRPGRTVAFLGSSGAGKSTLINRLLGYDRQRTNDVSEFKSKGKHTTTYRELIILPSGAIVIDTPGMREIQLWSSEASLNSAFEDIESLMNSCRFADCSHVSEPGCAVVAAIESGELNEKRYQSYLKLQKELQHLERKKDNASARRESREWGKRISQHHKAMKELRQMGLAGKKKDDKYDR